MQEEAPEHPRLLYSSAVCMHMTTANLVAWKALQIENGAMIVTADIARLRNYLANLDARANLSSEMYRCLSCKFRGIRELSIEQLQEIEDGQDDGSFMAHAILYNHNIAMMERKNQLYCASCRDFVYSDAAGIKMRQRTRQVDKMAIPSKLLRRGLVNMGNTCFMSSVLQALAHNPMLQHYFFVAKSHDTTICHQQRQQMFKRQKKEQGCSEEDEDGPAARRKPALNATVCLGCELAAFMSLLVPSSSQTMLLAPPIAPQGILEAMWSAFPTFIGTAQHDAHELLIALLGGLHSHTHPRVFVHGGVSPRFTPRGHTLCDCAVHQHFSGVLRSTLACGSCGHASHKFDPFLDVSLSLTDATAIDIERNGPMSEMSAITIEALLRQYSASEALSGPNQVYCVRCSKYQTHYKSLNPHTLPNVLVFHIRRLDFYRQQKLEHHVQFPLTDLNMRPFTSVGIDEASDRKSTKKRGNDPRSYLYDLVALVTHHGDSVNGGHYTSYVRDEGSVWILFDDTQVRTVAADDVEHSQAYLLYYVRQNPFIAIGA